VDHTNPNRVFVAALGKPYAPSAERGVFRSKDGGVTWTRVLFRNDSTGAADLVIDRTNPMVLYATLWQVYRTPWKLWSGGPGSGLFKSSDGGDTWTELTRNPGLPQGVIGKIGVSVSPADPNRVYAIVEAEDGGVFRSDDGGATWRFMNGERKLRQRAFYYTRLVADPKNADRVYVLNTSMYRSDDGGRTFPTVVADPHGDNPISGSTPPTPTGWPTQTTGAAASPVSGEELDRPVLPDRAGYRSPGDQGRSLPSVGAQRTTPFLPAAGGHLRIRSVAVPPAGRGTGLATATRRGGRRYIA
jgi:hypothetical protein